MMEYAGSVFPILPDNGLSKDLITKTARCPSVFLNSNVAGCEVNLTSWFAAFASSVASSVVRLLLTRLSRISLPVPNVAKLHRSAKSPSFKSRPEPTASMIPRPVLYLKGS
jgi:hypothetical protein